MSLLLVLSSYSTRQAMSLISSAYSHPYSFRTRVSRLSVRQHDASLMALVHVFAPWMCGCRDTGSQRGSGMYQGGIRQTELAISRFPLTLVRDAVRQNFSLLSHASCPRLVSLLLQQVQAHAQATQSQARWVSLPLACTDCGDYRGCRVGEASNPGPESTMNQNGSSAFIVSPWERRLPAPARSDCPRRVEFGFGLSILIPP